MAELLELLSPDLWLYRKGKRPLRSTGAALSIASSLLESLDGHDGHLILFPTGPCTMGPATIASLNTKTKINPFGYQECAEEFYQQIANRARSNDYTINICASLGASTPDRIGLSEMRRCVDSTGGSIVSGPSYDSPQLKDQIQKLLCLDQISLVYNGVFSVQTTKDLDVSRILGPCQPLILTPGKFCLTRGIRTSSWKLFNLNPTTTLGIYLTSEVLQWEPNPVSSCIQLITSYLSANGQNYSRVTTVTRPHTDLSHDMSRLNLTSFDCGATTALVTRWALHQSSALDTMVCYIEDHLVRLNNSFDGYPIGSSAELMRYLLVVFKHLKVVEDDCCDAGACQRHWMARANVRELLALINQHRRVGFVAISGLDAPSVGKLGMSTYHQLLRSFLSVKNMAEQLYKSFYVDTSMSYK